MAVVLDGFTASFHRVPFVKPPDTVRMFTAMPRAIVSFIVRGAPLSVKPINDQQTLQVLTNLPVQFAYRLIDMNMSITQDVAFDWEDGGGLIIVNGMRGTPLGTQTNHTLVGVNVLSFGPVTERKLWSMPDKMSGIVQSIAQGAAAITDWRVVNRNTAAGGAGFVNFFATWYEYDLEQVQMFPPLVPAALTYSMNS